MLDFTGFAAIDIARAMEAEHERVAESRQWLRTLRDLRRSEREESERAAQAAVAAPRVSLTGAHTPWI
jgi:hypothetical protein